MKGLSQGVYHPIRSAIGHKPRYEFIPELRSFQDRAYEIAKYRYRGPKRKRAKESSSELKVSRSERDRGRNVRSGVGGRQREKKR